MSMPTIMARFAFVPVMAAMLITGCEQLDFRSQTPDADGDEERRAERDDLDVDLEGETGTALETKLLGDYTTIAGLNKITLRGVGLVVGLKNTGGDPPPSYYRTTLLDEMRRRGINNPNQYLQSKGTALVLVEAHLPPMIEKGETFDLKVTLPGNSEAVSLQGGWLLETRLTEQQIVPGQGILKGNVLAKAKGPIMINTVPRTGGNRESFGALLRRGRILGGATSLKARDLTLFLRNDYRSIRMSKRVANAVGQRFHHYSKSGAREPLATPKTDQVIELKLHPRYKNNYHRYLQVIRSIANNETRVAKRVRMERLLEEIKNPLRAERAALQLEAIGSEAIPILKAGLKSRFLECRFHAAVALAYLNDSSGLKVLQEAARDEPAFRIFAIAAMSAVDDAEANILLKELMQVPSAETRYGAFRALTVMDPNDPDLRGRSMANGDFRLHHIPTANPELPPLIHLTHHRKSEVVLFGQTLMFRTPLSVRAGNHILVTAPAGAREVTVSRFQVGKEDQVRHVPLRIDAVIDAIADLGGTYPDLAGMLIEADRQGSLPGRLEIDALPRAGRVYYRPKPDAESPGGRATIGNRYLTPNIFPEDTGSDDGDDEPRDDDQPRRPDITLTSAETEETESETDQAPVRTAELTREVDDEPETEPAPVERQTEPPSDRKRNWRRLNPATWFGDDE